MLLSDAPGCRIKVTFGGNDAYREALEVDAMDFIAAKSYKARGKRLTTFEVDSIEELEPREVEIADDDDAQPQAADTETDTDDTTAEEERSDDEVRDEINGQQRIF
jgi:topoisomerase-4 subunit A